MQKEFNMWIYLGLALYNLVLGAGAIRLSHKMTAKGKIGWARFWLAFLPLNIVMIIDNLYKAFILPT
jgi:hypothetical protein